MKLHNILETLALLTGTSAALAGCAKPASQATEAPAKADDGEANAGPTTAAAWTRTWTIAPGDMAEINLELTAGDAMAATFSTDGGTLMWNVHSHEGSEAVVHARGDDTTGKPRYVADKAGMYSFLWKNEGTEPVQLTVELESGSTKVHSTHPAD